MAKVLFVSEQVLKSKTAINENVDTGELRFCIETAQDINIQETLGQELYDKLQFEVSANTLSGDYKYLLDTYVVPATIQWSYYHGLDNFFVKWMNVGLVQNRTEQGSNIDYKTFQFLKNNARSTAQFFDQNMRRYLCAYASLYPQFNQVPIGKILPKRTSAYRSSFALGRGYMWPGWYGPIVKTQP